MKKIVISLIVFSVMADPTKQLCIENSEKTALLKDVVCRQPEVKSLTLVSPDKQDTNRSCSCTEKDLKCACVVFTAVSCSVGIGGGAAMFYYGPSTANLVPYFGGCLAGGLGLLCGYLRDQQRR